MAKEEKIAMKDYAALYESLMANPKAKKIEYTISPGYVKTLTPVFGIKELIANFNDQNGTDFLMKYDGGALLLKDESTGIDIRYMIIGNSGSREDKQKIGEHGEGSKVGALTIVREGGKFLIRTVGYTLAFGLEKSELLNTEVMFAKYLPNDQKVGTEIYLECAKKDYEKAKNMFLFAADAERVSDAIFQTKGKMKIVYLNGLEHARKNAVFSYNIREKNQISNRDRNFVDQSALERSLIGIYEGLSDKEEIEKVMAAFMERRSDFDQTVEAKIADRLGGMRASARKLFKEALEPNVWYAVNAAALDEKEKKARKIVEVSPKLFAFLKLVGAGVLGEFTADFESGDALRTFEIEQSDLPEQEELEQAVASLLGARTQSCEDGKTVFDMDAYASYEPNWFASAIKDLKLTGKTMKKGETVKEALHNLIYLACHEGFKVSFQAGAKIYDAEAFASGGKFVVVLKAKDADDARRFRIIVEGGELLPESFAELEENWLFLNNLRFQKIDSMRSYKVGSIAESRIAGEVKSALSKMMKKAPKAFLSEVLAMDCWFYEQDFLPDLNEKQKEALRKEFGRVYPKSCLPFADAKINYNAQVEERYGCRALNHLAPRYLSWLASAGVPTSKELFMERQSAKIETEEPCNALKEAIALFEEAYGVESKTVLQAVSLPDGKESANREGAIYISGRGSRIPAFLAALIGYEHEQIQTGAATPSHALQSRLTHNLLG